MLDLILSFIFGVCMYVIKTCTFGMVNYLVQKHYKIIKPLGGDK